MAFKNLLKIRLKIAYLSARFSCMKRSDKRTADCSQFTNIKITKTLIVLRAKYFMPGRRFSKSLPTRLRKSAYPAAAAKSKAEY